MNIVMLEPLGVEKTIIESLSKKFTDRGLRFIPCYEKILEEKELIERSKDADILLIANTPLSNNVINSAKNLKMVAVAFTGVDHLDLDNCKKRGITVCNAQGYATEATAELTVGLMLQVLRKIIPGDARCRKNGTKDGFIGNELNGKTVGLIGTGAIGRRVAEILKVFNCKLIGYDIYKNQEAVKLGIEYSDLDELFRKSDIVTLHAPLLDSTKNIVNSESLALMKKTAILINAARGPLVNSQALANALNNDSISGAGLDVIEIEPPIPVDHHLLHSKNTVLTPHVAYWSEESMIKRAEITFENIDAWLNEKPQNVKI